MLQSTRRFFASVSLLCMVAAASAQVRVGRSMIAADSSRCYTMQLTFRNAEVSGICLLKECNGGLTGALMNEFGIKAFDFTYHKGKVKLAHVMSMMNKWYIRYTLRKDLACLLAATAPQQTKRHEVRLGDDGSLWLENKSHHITYYFKPIEQE